MRWLKLNLKCQNKKAFGFAVVRNVFFLLKIGLNVIKSLNIDCK